MFSSTFGLAIAVATTIIAGIQLDTFRLQHTDPFYYHSIKVLTPQVKRGEFFREELDVERFRICRVTIFRSIVSLVTGDVFFREEVPGGATPIGRTKPPLPENKVLIPFDAPIGRARIIQNVSSHCIEGMHTKPWPILEFEIVE